MTDDATGLLAVVDLSLPQIVARIQVGLGAHHLAFSPDGNRAGPEARSSASRPLET